MQISRGQRLKLGDIGIENRPFAIQLDLDAGGLVLDVACFGLDDARRLSDERYMTFFNQPASPCGAVLLGTANRYDFDLGRLPATIQCLTLTLALDGGGQMRQIGRCRAKITSHNETVGQYAFDGSHFAAERAVMLLEIYRKDGVWRLNAVGQGFNGGLDALVTHFGGSVAEKPTSAPPSSPPPSKISLSKVTLTKAGQSHRISLLKGSSAPSKIVVKAVWIDNGDGLDNDDLDLRAGVLLPDGRMTLVTAPDRPGRLDAFPYLRHLGDVTSASVAAPATEIIEVNPRIGELLKGPVALVFSVYSAISNGAVSVRSLSPRMVMEYGEQVVECNFDFSGEGEYAENENIYTYVIGQIEISGDAITLSPSGLTSDPNSEATPWLTRRGGRLCVTMDGPDVFKGAFDEQIDPTCSGREYL